MSGQTTTMYPPISALLSSDSLGTYDDRRKDPTKVPGFSRIVQQVRFTQKFILTYHALVIAIILVLSIIHWSQILRRTVRERRRLLSHADTRNIQATLGIDKDDATVNDTERDGYSSSGSSTLDVEQHDSTNNKSVHEQSPLLGGSSRLQPKPSIISRARALWMSQPPPIPFVNKKLPSNGTSLFIICFLAVNIFYLLYDVADLKSLFAFSDRAGTLFVANLPLLYLLAAKNQPLKLFTGHSYESLNIFHRRLGEWLCLLALFHATGMMAVWWVVLRPVGWSLLFYLSQKIVLTGLFAFISFEVLYLTSLASFRQKCYELFLVLHVVLQTAALILLWFHHHHARIYVGIALAIFLIDRVVFRAIIKTSVANATLTVMDSGTVKLSAPVKFSTRRWFRRFINHQHGWKATDHVFLTVPSLSRKHWIQAHPFTIASGAPLANDKEARLDLIIRAQDGFSRDLLRYAMIHHQVKVRLDGPYGSQHALKMLRDNSASLLVAGGSGIAVVYPLLHALAMEMTRTKDVEATDGHYTKRRIGLIWIVREEPHKAWLGEGELEALSKEGVDVIVPRATEEGGRPDIRHMLESWLQVNMDEEHSTGGVVCCGPDEMSRTVRNSCAGLVGQGFAVDVLIEKFGW